MAVLQLVTLVTNVENNFQAPSFHLIIKHKFYRPSQMIRTVFPKLYVSNANQPVTLSIEMNSK